MCMYVRIYVRIYAVPVLALPAHWTRVLRRPLTAIQTHMKKGKGYNEIAIYKEIRSVLPP